MARLLPLTLMLLIMYQVGFAASRSATARPEDFDTTTTCGSVELQLRGVGAYKFMAWDVFYVGVYAETPSATAEDLLGGQQPFVVELHYNWSVKRKDLVSRIKNSIEENNETDSTAIREDLARFYANCRSVKKGDISRVSYTPETGSNISFNGQPLLLIEDQRFAQAFLSLWAPPHAMQASIGKSIFQ